MKSRERENMSVLAKHATVNNDEDIRERAANGAVSTSGKGAGFARFFYHLSSREVMRANRIVSFFLNLSLSSTRKF